MSDLVRPAFARFVAEQQQRSATANTLFDIHEMLTALHDPVYFAGHTTIPTLNGVCRFRPRTHQEVLLRHITEHRCSIINKARQIGMSACLARYALWRASMQSHATIMVLSYRKQMALELLDQIRFAHASLPAHLRAEIVDTTRGRISFDNGSTIFGRLCNADAGRGMAVSHVILDDAAHVAARDFEEYWTGWYPVHHSFNGTTFLIASTPGTTRGLFYDIWREAEDGANPYVPLRLDYRRAPAPHIDYDEIRKNLGEVSFRQEFECHFPPSR